MADKRAGNTAGSQRVSFTRSSAQRIASAVRSVEQGNRDARPGVSIPRSVGSGGVSLKRGTFTGSWNIGETKTVQLSGGTNTASVQNLFISVKSLSGNEDVVFGSAGGTNVAVGLQLDQVYNIGGDISKIASFAETSVQILGHDQDGKLKWFPVITCSTATSG
jgi:hypothetical protein